DRSRQAGGPQNGAAGQLGIFLEDLVHRRIEEFQEMFGALGLPFRSGIGGRRRWRWGRRGIAWRRGGGQAGDISVWIDVGGRICGRTGQGQRGNRDQVRVQAHGPVRDSKQPPALRLGNTGQSREEMGGGSGGRRIGDAGGRVGGSGGLIRGCLGRRRWNLRRHLRREE